MEHRRRASRLARASLLFVACSVAPVGVAAAQEQEPQEKTGAMRVQDTRTVLEQWVQTRRVISKEKRDWVLGKQLLQDRIDLVKREMESLRERIEETKSNLSEADKKKIELVETSDKLLEASSSLRSLIFRLEFETRELLRRLPEPIRDHVKPLSQKIPEEGPTGEVVLGPRYQNIVGILNEVDKFNREIRVTNEVRQLDDGSSAEVATLYIGLGQAYYVNTKGDRAGVGTQSDDGWVWEQHNDAAADIALAIAILRNEKPAAFVRLPMGIK